MSRTFLVGLALIGLAACGGDSKDHRTAHAKTSAPAARRATTQRSTATKAKTQRKRGARSDTTSQRNPLTNH